MVQRKPDMKRLTKDQQKVIVEIITEEAGSNLGYDEFGNRVLLLLEDVAGFETISSRDSKRIVQQLWRNYHGQHD
jgi:hypothetical protein